MWADNINYSRKGPAPGYALLGNQRLDTLTGDLVKKPVFQFSLQEAGSATLLGKWYFKGNEDVPPEFETWRWNPARLSGRSPDLFYQWNGTRMDVCVATPAGEFEVDMKQLKDMIVFDKHSERLMKLDMANEQEPYIGQSLVTPSEAYPWTPPERWYIRGDRDMNKMLPELKKWKGNPNRFWGDAHRGLYVYDGTTFYQASGLPEGNYQEITVDQLRQIINMKETSNKRVVGYRVIKALPDVDKGSVATQDADYWSFPANARSGWATRRYSDKTLREATEYFEPIYEEIAITIGKYTAKVVRDKIEFGCQTFTREQLEVYLNLLTRDFRVKVNIEGVDITADMVRKVLNMLPSGPLKGGFIAEMDCNTIIQNELR